MRQNTLFSSCLRSRSRFGNRFIHFLNQKMDVVRIAQTSRKIFEGFVFGNLPSSIKPNLHKLPAFRLSQRMRQMQSIGRIPKR